SVAGTKCSFIGSSIFSAHPPIAILATDMFLARPGPEPVRLRLLRPPGGAAGSSAAQRMSEPAVPTGGLPAVARCAKRLPSVPVPEHHLVAAMWINVIDDVCRADHAMLFTVDTQRMLPEKRRTSRLPALRAV